MIGMLQDWKGTVEYNNKPYDSINDFTTDFIPGNDSFHIILHPVTKNGNTVDGNNGVEDSKDKQEYRITVKRYMTQKSSAGFDFMQKWNNDVPMPLRVMTGTKVKETRGMVYMELHGDIYAKKICTCMKCGKRLTNPVSQYFGIGPECGNHNYVNPFDSKEELQEAVEAYRSHLQDIKWSGWIIKSAIKEEVCL